MDFNADINRYQRISARISKEINDNRPIQTKCMNTHVVPRLSFWTCLKRFDKGRTSSNLSENVFVEWGKKPHDKRVQTENN